MARKIWTVYCNILFILTSPLWILPTFILYFCFDKDASRQRHGEAYFI